MTSAEFKAYCFAKSLHIEDGSDPTPLFGAARENDISKLKQLIFDGADVNARDKYKRTALHTAAMKNEGESHYEVCEILLNNGADVNAVGLYGDTPIFYLVEHGNLRIVQELFINKFKADVKVISRDGGSLLFKAGLYYNNENSEAVVKLLVDLGLDVNHCDEKGETPLFYASGIAHENIKVAKFLMRKGAIVNMVNNKGITAVNEALGNSYDWDEVSPELVKRRINFVMENTDFSLACNVFEAFSGRAHLIAHLIADRNEERAWKILLEHLAKLQDLDISMHPHLLNTISSKDIYKTYFEQCLEELLRTKSVKLKNSWITFYNFLVDDRKKLKNYAGNEDLIEDFKNREDWVLEKFPIYGALIEENVKKAIEKRKLFDKSSFVLSNNLPIFNPTHLIIKDILDCILSTKDLLKLCNLAAVK